MTINIPLSTELLTWWIKNVTYDNEFEFSAPLPIKLDFGGQMIDLAKFVNLAFSYEDDQAKVNGYVGVSASNDKAQVRMFGCEYIRDKVEFKLTDEERQTVKLAMAAADTIADRAIHWFATDRAKLYNDHSYDEED